MCPFAVNYLLWECYYHRPELVLLLIFFNY